MRAHKNRGFSLIAFLLAVAIVAAIFFFLTSRSPAPHTTHQTSAQEASSTINQALQLTKWIAKEYAPQKH